ncbi:NUDIX hydrolase [Paenibacillus aestuarii]|uniref:NUDIX domain-containing protein n=1 Tax=Paenibacillus aestuarii TaxID=516965 RepID=A0ABW0K5D9_9BACL|nr:NUDIX domain-containing protein [Paenibacillus aestuarii]
MTTQAAIDKIAWIHIVDGRVLGARSKGKDTYYFPGGKREAGESDEETLVREIEEELSVRITTDSIQYYGTFEAQADGKPAGVMVRMTCYCGEFTGKLQSAAEIEECVWLTYQDRERVSAVSQIIFDHLLEQNLISK